MKIYTQDRNHVVEVPRELWVTQVGENGAIFATTYSVNPLGNYGSPERAREVLSELFQYYRNGKNSYIMPLE